MVVGTEAASGPRAFGCFSCFLSGPFKGNVSSAGAVDAGRGCLGPRAGGVLEEELRSCRRAEDSEAFPQPPAGACGSSTETVCAGRAAWRTAASRAGPAQPGSSAAQPSAQPQLPVSCLRDPSPIWASSRMQAKQLLPITCSSPFSSPWRPPSVPTPLPTDRRDSVGTDLISRLQGRLVLFGFWRKTLAKENS